MKQVVLRQIAEGDLVATHYDFEGTHEGEFLMVPGTGNKVSFTYLEICRIEDGKLAEAWIILEGLGLLRQLGVELVAKE